MLFLSSSFSTAWGNLRVSKPRQCAKEEAFITRRRHPCSQGKKDEHPKRGKRERDRGKQEVEIEGSVPLACFTAQ